MASWLSRSVETNETDVKLAPVRVRARLRDCKSVIPAQAGNQIPLLDSDFRRNDASAAFLAHPASHGTASHC